MEPTNSQILEAINGLKSDVTGLKSDVTGLKSNIGELKSDVTGLKSGLLKVQSDLTEMKEILEGNVEMTASLKEDVEILKTDVIGIKATMVTKDYLDEKLAATYGRSVELIRKEDDRVSTLVGALREKEYLSDSDVRLLETLKPLASV